MNHIKLLAIFTLLLIHNLANAYQIDSVAARNMSSFKKFDGLVQNAIVIKTSNNNIPYVDKIELSSGGLTNGEDSSFFVSAGPSWRFNKRVARSGLAYIEFGINPTWIDNGHFSDESLGGSMFFTSNVQLGVHFGRHRELSLSVRVHHISNGGLSTDNPGTDMIGFEMSYLFGR